MAKNPKCPHCRSRQDTLREWRLNYCDRCGAYWNPHDRKVNRRMPGSKSRSRWGVRGSRAGKSGLKKDHHGLFAPWEDRWWFGHDLKWYRKACHRKIRQRWRAKLIEERKAA